MAYVLTDGDLIIGIITAIIVPSIGMNSISVDTVAISPAYQRKGYGKQMFSEFFKKTRGFLLAQYAAWWNRLQAV